MSRRIDAGRSPLDITPLIRICNNCNFSIERELQALENDPSCSRLNVLRQTSSHSCMIYTTVHDEHRLSLVYRINIFVQRNIYIPETTVCWRQHLYDNRLLFQFLRNDLQFTNRSYVIRGKQLQLILQTKQQFNELFAFVDPVKVDDTLRYISKKDLLAFLGKMRQELSDEFLRVVFNYSMRQKTSYAISLVRQSLIK
ncbi:hypothetical protein ALC57_02389 [Trachymyrmex cornetzi]|uniref:Uncharacterized protein n=1 Tax=Trachymyrmex cornetzi TaxID=471704 RepID=A0A151JNQ9_9HYME|nr:hypothetical protein ALC57_02389 [Trachymyrmex cornetzi]